MPSLQHDLTIFTGTSFQYVYQWLGTPPIHQPISAVQPGWPTIVTVANHGITGRVPVWVTNVRIPRALNTDGPYGCKPWYATVMDANTLALDVNTGFDQEPYLGNGILTNLPLTNLTGYTADLQVRASAANPNILLELSTANGGVTLDVATGEITLAATPAQTLALLFQQGMYDLFLTSPTGVVTRLAYGNVNVITSVTQPAPAP
ncbi:MAG: hypothetical protein WA777_12695 [Rhodanobacter sp.]